MQPYSLLRTCLCVVFSLFILTACGQKGDLYLPDSQTEQSQQG
jgi:predicted small lipoprotein YifL